MTPFAEAFFARCRDKGLTLQQTKEAVDSVGLRFGKQVYAELEDGLEKEAIFGALGRGAVGLFNGVGRPAARMFGQGAKAGLGAVDKTNQAARAGAKAVGDASVAGTTGYAKNLAGYGKGGNLEGRKLFDSTTVKPLMSRGEMQQRMAGGATQAQLEATHQLPGWASRIPGVGMVSRGINALDRNRFTHPFVQAGQTAKNLLSTPLTRPITKPIENSLLARGAANVAKGGGSAVLGRAQQAGGYGLKGVDKTLGAATQLASLGTLGTGGYALYNQVTNAPAKNLQQLVDHVNPHAGPNPEVAATRADPLSAYYDAATDNSDIANAARATSQRALPYRLQNAAHNSLEQAKNDPVQGALSNLSRFTLGGNLSYGATNAIADPTPPPVEKFFKEEVAKRGPEIMANPMGNFNSPTGQRLFRAGTPLVTDPTSYTQMPGVTADTVADVMKKGGSDMTPFASAFFTRCREKGLNFAQIKTAVDRVGTGYGEQVRTELTEGLQKLAFLDSFDKMVGGDQGKPKAAPTAPSPGTLPVGKNQVNQKTQAQQVTHPQGMGKVSIKQNTGSTSLAPPPMSITGPKTMQATAENANEMAAGSAQQLASQYAPSGWSMMGGQQMAQGLGTMFGQKTGSFEKDAAGLIPDKNTLVSGAKYIGGLFRPAAKGGATPMNRLPAAAPHTAPNITGPRAATGGLDNAGAHIAPDLLKTAPRAATAAGRTWNAMSPGTAFQMGMGGLQGNMTANAMGGGTGSFEVGGGGIDPATGQVAKGWRINPLGIAGGMLMGNRGFRSSATGQTLWRPLAQASAGGNIGMGMDALGGMTGHADPNDPEKWSRRLSRAGLFTGAGGNIAAARNSAALRSGVPQSSFGQGFTNMVGAPSNIMTRAGAGTMDPLYRVGHFLTGKGAYQSGAAGLSGAKKLGFRAGQGITYGTGAGMLGGAGYAALHDQVNNDVDTKIQGLKKQFVEEDYPALRANMSRDADEFMHQRGLLNEHGQFDPTQEIQNQFHDKIDGWKQRASQATNPFLTALGYNPEQMTGGQRGMAFGGMGLGGLGLLTGNPLMMAGGAGMAAYPHVQAHGGVANAWQKLTGGAGGAGSDQNELHKQQQNARAMTGQGWN